MDNGLLAERRALKRLNRTCSGLNSLVGQFRAAMKNRSLEQSDRYALYLLIEKYTRRFVELDRKRKLIKRALSAGCQGPAEEGEKQSTNDKRSRSKKKRKTKAKKKRKLRYPKTPIQVEHAAKKKRLHQISGSRSIRAKFVPGGATGLKK